MQHNIYLWSILFSCLLANTEKKNLENMNIIEFQSIISEGVIWVVWVCCGLRTLPTAHSNQFQLFHDSGR
jgi:hypothetical protein